MFLHFDFKGLKLSYYDSGREPNKPVLLFAHANGYAAGVYSYYHKALANTHRILALDFSGHGKSESTLNFENWFFFRDQLLALLDHEKVTSCTGIGHSLGGASILLAGEKEPERFDQIIALDPTILGFVPVVLSHFLDNPLAKGARNRRREFSSLKLVEKAYRKLPVFKNWDESIFRDYLEFCIHPAGDGCKLACDPLLEAQIFARAAFRVYVRHFFNKTKNHVIVPKPYSVCPLFYAKLLSRNSGSYQVWEGSTHFFPFEEPARTLSAIRSIIDYKP